MRTLLFCSFLIFQTLPLRHQSSIFLSPLKYNIDHFKTIGQSYTPPKGFKRIPVKENSFAAYLRNMPVLTDSVNVLDFKNRVWIKSSDSSLAGVIPLNISGKRLWQCMDILIVLHVDYLLKTHIQHIEYPLPDGTLLSWTEWQKGIRPVFKGLRFNKTLKSKADSSKRNFNRYLNAIFEYSGSQTFYHYYDRVPADSIMPGYFITKKGKKGHAVIILDMAENQYGEKCCLFAQGDTPACQMYVLKKNGNPWIKMNKNEKYPNLPIKKIMPWAGLRRFPGKP